MRKKAVKVGFLNAIFTLFFIGYAFARPIAGYDVQFDDIGTSGTTNGGEFHINVLNGYGVDYMAFCLELNEYISRTGKYTISSVVDYAEKGGIDGQTAAEPDKDFLSDETKWVYWNYFEGKFDGWNGENEDTVANYVQETIWQLEDETANYSSSFLTMVNDQSDYSISGDVFVLNLEDGSGTFKQSMIVAEAVPEPATMLLFGTGLIGLAGAAHRRKKKQQ